ncbi:MAG: type II toxin-antitoxin system RelB/DinJ family antitoxin [Clostridiales bacterium]|nr:type II toxin-antitoxin system RelB/DinJ family antitoxin [Clostridiales bacterium]
MAKVSTNITIDAEVKKQAQELFADLGMDLSTAINVFLKKALAEQGIPFEVSREIPNSVTVAALEEFDDVVSNPDKYKRYSSFTDVLNEVL